MIWRVERRDLFLALRAGSRGRSGPVSVTWLAGPAADPPRVAFAVGRKVGGAVTRNRLRRQLRAHLRLTEVLPSGTYLVALAPDAAALSAAALRTATDHALRAALAPRRARAAS